MNNYKSHKKWIYKQYAIELHFAYIDHIVVDINMSSLQQIECLTLSQWLKDHRFVMLTGAGISVSAGLQPFRVNNKSLNKASLSALEFKEHGNPMKVFNHVARMVDDAMKAKPSKFHLFLKYFIKRKQLIRNYSMNIDCLENEVRTRGLDGFYTDLASHTVRLHGEILKAICFRCSKVYELTDQIVTSWKSINSSDLATCDECVNRPRESKLRKLTIPAAKLRPHIVLYDEELPCDSQN
ncbi:DHS-like NAD/FAD-binding domain-containing protein, partial [Globomyces pollinis-pini]